MMQEKICSKTRTCSRPCPHKLAHDIGTRCSNRYCPDMGLSVCVDVLCSDHACVMLVGPDPPNL